jgi:glycosyltransferase involved in cell wall biosynthesis
MKKVLFVSIAFPPKKDPECIQTAKYFKYLCKSENLSIDVLTSGDTLFMPFDQGMVKYNLGYENRYKVEIFENKYLNFLIRKTAPALLERPDSKATFHLQWERAISKLKNRPDIIYSRSFPISSAIMALNIAMKLDIPWIMHLSDPWTLSPIHQYQEDSYHNRMEEKCFSVAHKICLTTYQAIDLYVNKYPKWAKKFEFFPNVYDLDDRMVHSMEKSEKLRIVYTGGLVGQRNPSFFLQTLSELVEEYPQIREKVEVIFAGQCDRQSKAIFEKYRYLKQLEYRGELSLEEAKFLQNSAQILLLIDNPIRESSQAVFLPSKVLDYLLTERRIIAITTLEGATHIALKGIKHDFVGHGDKPALKSALLTAIEKLSNNNRSYFTNNILPKEYEASENSNRLEKILLESCRK